jgi:glutathione S-transferase
MKLHAFVGSPNSRKVEAVISHLGLVVEIVRHDFFAGALRAPGYLALNPNGMVPVLEDGAFTLSESNAIMQYLADQAGDQDLFPRDPRRRADIVRWQFWELAHFNKALGLLAFETVAKPRNNLGPTNHALVDIANADLARFAPVLDGHMAGRRYVVGAAITIADYSMVPFESYRGRVPFDFTPYRHLNAYFDRMHDADHWAKTAPAVPIREVKAA